MADPVFKSLIDENHLRAIYNTRITLIGTDTVIKIDPRHDQNYNEAEVFSLNPSYQSDGWLVKTPLLFGSYLRKKVLVMQRVDGVYTYKIDSELFPKETVFKLVRHFCDMHHIEDRHDENFLVDLYTKTINIVDAGVR